MNPGALPYRREIDGLRAVAVLPVILFHAGFEVFSGGFVGVDVFFVISGYLITSIILREQDEGRFSILAFYERRARRILPALFVVLLACLPFAWAWMLPGQLQDFGESLGAISLFSSNIFFASENGYFARSAELKPLLHTWSLAVEEQFYLIFPLLLLALGRWRPRSLPIVVGGLAVLSLVLSEWALRREPTATFYLLPTRAWELLAGSLLALWLRRRERPTGLVSEVGAGLGLAMIVGAILRLDETTPFPGLWALVPVVGSGLVILCADRSNWTGRLLGWRPLVAIGLISYSAYLWHQPLFAFARIRSVLEPSPLLMAGLSVLVLPLAWATWRFVETPFRKPRTVSRKQIFVGALIGVVGLGGAGKALDLLQGAPKRIDPEILTIAKFDRSFNPGTKGCIKVEGQAASYCVYNPQLGKRVALWGDSHAASIAPKLAKTLAAEGYSLVNFARPRCDPVPKITREGGDWCIDYKAAASAFLNSDAGPETVILVARWTLILEQTPFDNQERGVEFGKRPTYFATGSTRRQPGEAERAAAMRDSVETLLRSGKRVILVGSIPEAGWNVPQTMTKIAMFGGGPQPLSTSSAAFRARNRRTQQAFDALSPTPRLIRVEPSELFCDRQLAGRCLNEWDGLPLYRDDDHPSSRGAHWIAAQIVAAMKGDAPPVLPTTTPASPYPRR